MRTHHQIALLGLILVGAAANTSAEPAQVSASRQNAAPIPLDQIGAVAGKHYSGDGLAAVAANDGGLLRCVFQRMNARATTQGLWLTSTVDSATGDPFRVMAMAVGRETDTGVGGPFTPFPVLGEEEAARRAGEAVSLPSIGTVEVGDNVARFVRPGLTEEYSVSVDGLRQDFVLAERPAGEGELRVELAVDGAKAESLVDGVRLVLADGGRRLNYHRLRVADASGKELPAKMEVLSEKRLVVLLDDTAAEYPVRIDPTFSDANWMSMGGVPGADSSVSAAVVDGAGNLYIGGSFTTAGGVAANCIAKWDGSSWSALGSGMTGMNDSVVALAASGTNLYAGGSFTTAGGVAAKYVAKWDGNSWSALGSGMDLYVMALSWCDQN